ncbi:unnamed protein product, partial [Mycena citricolor]
WLSRPSHIRIPAVEDCVSREVSGSSPGRISFFCSHHPRYFHFGCPYPKLGQRNSLFPARFHFDDSESMKVRVFRIQMILHYLLHDTRSTNQYISLPIQPFIVIHWPVFAAVHLINVAIQLRRDKRSVVPGNDIVGMQHLTGTEGRTVVVQRCDG